MVYRDLAVTEDDAQVRLREDGMTQGLTVDEMIAALQTLSAEGHGSRKVVISAIRYGESEECELEAPYLKSGEYGPEPVVYLRKI